MKKIISYLAKSNILIYSISISIIIFIVRGLVSVCKDIFSISDPQFRERLINENFQVTVDLLLDTLVLAPIFETLLFQTLFFAIFKRIKTRYWIISIISGIAFGLFHNYSVFYMINTFLIGFIFMYMYLLRAEINNKPFISTIMAHFTVNLIVIIATLITHFSKFGTWF